MESSRVEEDCLDWRSARPGPLGLLLAEVRLPPTEPSLDRLGSLDKLSLELVLGMLFPLTMLLMLSLDLKSRLVLSLFHYFTDF